MGGQRNIPRGGCWQDPEPSSVPRSYPLSQMCKIKLESDRMLAEDLERIYRKESAQ